MFIKPFTILFLVSKKCGFYYGLISRLFNELILQYGEKQILVITKEQQLLYSLKSMQAAWI